MRGERNKEMKNTIRFTKFLMAAIYKTTYSNKKMHIKKKTVPKI